MSRRPGLRGRRPLQVGGGEGGFLLVEVLVALVLLGVGISATATLLTRTARDVGREWRLAAAAPLAWEVVEAGPRGGDGEREVLGGLLEWEWAGYALHLQLRFQSGTVGRRLLLPWDAAAGEP